MTDLLRVLPHFPVGRFAALIPALERQGVSTSDLLTLDAADIVKRTRLPLQPITRLCSAVLDALHTDLGVVSQPPQQLPQVTDEPGSGAGPEPADEDVTHQDRAVPGQQGPRDSQQTVEAATLRSTAASLSAQSQTISTLDPELDRALGGGIPAGYVTEVTGESGVGKTQFLLTLLLSVQLPPPHGLGRPALYISTEAPLSTRRLAQMLAANPLFQRLPPAERPSLDNIISTATPDLESQDHILTFQVPVEVERRGIGLLVLDSVAANYRAEFERSVRHGSNMAARTTELVKLGMHLRALAQRHNLAVVVANQVADRFAPAAPQTPASSLLPHHHRRLQQSNQQHPQPTPLRHTQESPLATRSRPQQPHPPQPDHPPTSTPPPPPFASTHHLPSSDPTPSATGTALPLLLDHQQRWFTGWGDDDPYPSSTPLKTPSLGLVWTAQLAVRIALFRRPKAFSGLYRVEEAGVGGGGASRVGGGVEGGMIGTGGWRRWMKVVFAAHAPESGPGLDTGGGGGGGGRARRKGGKVGAVEYEVWMGGLRSRVSVEEEKAKGNNLKRRREEEGDEEEVEG